MFRATFIITAKYGRNPSIDGVDKQNGGTVISIQEIPTEPFKGEEA